MSLQVLVSARIHPPKKLYGDIRLNPLFFIRPTLSDHSYSESGSEGPYYFHQKTSLTLYNVRDADLAENIVWSTPPRKYYLSGGVSGS